MATKKLKVSGLKTMSDVVKSRIDTELGPSSEISLDLIDLKPQVRTKVRGLEELAESIARQGVESPIILHVEHNGRYLLIAGERRFRAAGMAGLTTIPARLKRNQTALQMRNTQVTENTRRQNLTAYEQAMGVIEDVDKYGVKEAMVIWGKSEGWISKRVAVRKYDTRIMKLMDEEISDDFELLQTLNQIIILKPDDFYLLEARLREGQVVTRDEARAKLAGIKSWLAEQEQMASRRKQFAHKPEDADQVDQTAEDHDDNVIVAAAQSATSKQAAAKAPAGSSKSGDVRSTRNRQSAHAPEDLSGSDAGAEHEQKRRAFQERLVTVFEIGANGRASFDALKTDLIDLACTKDQADWVLWSEFLTIALPLLTVCGPERSASMLKRLQSELRQKGIVELWQDLYPGVNDRIAVMPEDWRL